MGVFGILLLLPGVCFLQFGAGGIGAILCLVAVLLIIGAIARAARGSPST
jgi:hypothetical protein